MNSCRKNYYGKYCMHTQWIGVSNREFTISLIARPKISMNPWSHPIGMADCISINPSSPHNNIFLFIIHNHHYITIYLSAHQNLMPDHQSQFLTVKPIIKKIMVVIRWRLAWDHGLLLDCSPNAAPVWRMVAVSVNNASKIVDHVWIVGRPCQVWKYS